MLNTTVLDRQKGKVASEALLGRLMWYTVPEATMIDHKTIILELHKVGLSRALPNYPEDHNVFKRVSKNAERRKIPHNGTADQFENWMVRDVASKGEDTITRRIVVEIVNPQGRKLDYAQVADIEFRRPKPATDTTAAVAGKLKFVWQPGCDATTYPMAQEIMAEIQVAYARWKGKLNDYAIREWIRKTILSMGATPVRPSGGVYFLEERHASQVDALERFVAAILPNGGECHSVEIPDNDKQREMVRKAIEAETTGEIEKMMAEIQHIKSEGRLTPARYLQFLADVQALESKMGSYSTLLKKDLSAVSTRLTLLHGMAKGLAPLQKKGGTR